MENLNSTQDILQSVISAELKRYRNDHNLSDRELAEKLSITMDDYLAYEQGLVLPPVEIVLTFMTLMPKEELVPFLKAATGAK